MAIHKKKDDEIFKKALIILIHAFVVIIVVLTASIGLSLSVQNMKISYEIEKLKEELKTIELDNKEIYIKIAQKTNLSQLEKIGREKFKMIQPQSIKYIYLKNRKQKQK